MTGNLRQQLTADDLPPELEDLIRDERLILPGELQMFDQIGQRLVNDGRGYYLTSDGRLIEPGSIT